MEKQQSTMGDGDSNGADTVHAEVVEMVPQGGCSGIFNSQLSEGNIVHEQVTQ